MADNVAVTPGTGATIATDDVGGVQYQRVKVDGGGDGAATPILAGGGVEASALRVTIASDSTGVVSVDDNGSTLSIDDGAGSITIDAPVGTPAFVRLSDGASAITTLPVSVAAATASIAKAQSGTFSTGHVGVEVLALRMDTPSDLAAVDGTYDVLQVSGGRLWTSTVIPVGAATIAKAEDEAHVSGDVGVPALSVRKDTAAATSGTDGDYQPLITDANGRLHVVQSGGISGDVAHDAADSGNPVKVGHKAKSALSGVTLVADADRADSVSDLDGAVVNRPFVPLGDVIMERVSDTGGTSTAFSNFGATASTRNYLTTITVYNDSSTTGYLDIRDGTSGTVLHTIPLPAKGGGTVNFPIPLRSTANTAIAYDVSAALTTVYISVIGFKSKC